ncbi:TetR/AcrR family transcriptional regulator [Streptomyces pathocidini]|uniref:TetR/AcrR family transcriptional regulator n=1 Tax=Streptomyces pathocidini TaxID=1650571 RepID=A0ABW7UUU5_9ACTN
MTPMAPARTSTTTGPTGPAGPRLGLRERKKIKTRQAIRHAAYRLFTERGYGATPIERIAEAAEVSPSTVFRYFPTKEDLVLTDEYDPMIGELLRNRPAGEPALESIRHVMIGTLREAAAHEREETLLRARLVSEVPAIRARMSESNAATGRMLADVLAERTGRSADDLEMRLFVTVVLNAFEEALLYWAERGAAKDLVDILDRTVDTLATGLPLQPGLPLD